MESAYNCSRRKDTTQAGRQVDTGVCKYRHVIRRMSIYLLCRVRDVTSLIIIGNRSRYVYTCTMFSTVLFTDDFYVLLLHSASVCTVTIPAIVTRVAFVAIFSILSAVTHVIFNYDSAGFALTIVCFSYKNVPISFTLMAMDIIAFSLCISK